MTGLEFATVVWVLGEGFRRIEDCSTEWALRDWHAGHYRSARERVTCTDAPYLGKTPIGVLTVAQSVTSAPLTASIGITRHRPERANRSWPVSGRGLLCPFAVAKGRACGDACLAPPAPMRPAAAPPAPIPLPVTVWLLGSAVAGLWFWGSVIRWVLS